ncbi:MAG: lamin tail domain-containing protein, partial [Bacteroidia bacterium]|nr:lamin tail domain-containing protein [Bacteroidia bacterium]
MRKFFTLKLLFFVANVCVAQINDSFSDGDFTSNPVWSGSNADFIVNGSNQLQLSNSLAGTSYLTVPFNVADLSQFDLEWQVYVKQTFASSSSNFGRVYLVSDQQNLTQPLNGYYLQFGEAGTIDAVELFQQTGTVRTSICRATNGSIAASFALRIKVLRNGSGTWQLLVDYSGGNSFNLEASGIDATHNTSSFAGVVCVYTSTNANKFFYDDFLILNTPIPDAIPPMLQSVKVIDGATVDLLFSESLDAPQSNTRSNYSVNQNIGIPSTAILQNDNKTVRLGFTNSFKNGYEHQLSISGIRDIAGNEIGPLEKAFLYFVPITAQVKDIIINEFFPDPSPIIGLPEQEFVEIYNRSAHPFDLAGWQLTDRSSIAMLPSQIILPNEYWIITTSSGVPLFSSLGKTLGTSNFPTLNNSGDKIILLDPTGLKVDSLSYNLKWYSDADKQQGGWTVELLNPDTLRYDSTNWLASFDIRGGTPGKQNSQFGKQFDQTPPTWLNLLVINQNELLLNFNEALNTTSIQNPTSYSINNQIGSPTKITLSSDKRAVTLSFSEVFVNGVIDTLSVVGITDLAGNLLFPTKKSFLYFLPSVVHSKDIIINEFMADPTPVVGLPEAEYIELYNRSTNPIDLANWKLSDGSSFAIFPSNIIHPKEYWIVVSSSVVQQFTSFSNVLGLSNFPSFNNNGDKIILSDPTGLTVDSLSYNLKWYRDLDKQVGGWSLELLNSDTLRYDSANWLASIDYNGGTPGKKNSQDGKFFDQTPPSLISVTPISQSLLQLSFDEKLEQTSSESITNYKANNQLENPQSATLSSDKKTVVLSFQETFKNGVTNSIIITGISDLSGNLLKSAQRDFLYFIPQPINPKDLIITEIMTDPAPVVGLPEAEYIEIFNRSINAIDLLNWTLTDGGSIAKFPSKIIQPNDYLIVHASTSTQFNSYPNKISLVSFPSLNNTSDSIVLKNSSSITIDSIAYT